MSATPPPAQLSRALSSARPMSALPVMRCELDHSPPPTAGSAPISSSWRRSSTTFSPGSCAARGHRALRPSSGGRWSSRPCWCSCFCWALRAWDSRSTGRCTHQRAGAAAAAGLAARSLHGTGHWLVHRLGLRGRAGPGRRHRHPLSAGTVRLGMAAVDVVFFALRRWRRKSPFADTHFNASCARWVLWAPCSASAALYAFLQALQPGYRSRQHRGAVSSEHGPLHGLPAYPCAVGELGHQLWLEGHPARCCSASR